MTDVAPRPRVQPAGRSRPSDADLVLDANDASLLDIVDNVLSKGVVLSGDLTIALETLLPYPFSSQTIAPGDYRATLRVTR